MVSPPTLNILPVIPDAPIIGIPDAPTPAFGPTDALGLGLSPEALLETPVDGRIYTQQLVERAAVFRPDNPQPEYPGSLRAAMIEGRVVVQFVVDSAGRVEPGSVSVLEPAHELFVESTRRWLNRTRYVPARIGQRPVRQLVQQEIAFTLKR